MRNIAPKPSLKFTAPELRWIADFQYAAGAKPDEIIGRETLWHIRRAINRPANSVNWALAALACGIGAAAGFAAAVVVLA